MKIELMTVDKEQILKKILEYIDSKEDKKTFNEELKKIFKINSLFEELFIGYVIDGLIYFEDSYSESVGTNKKIISELINSIDIKNGERIYEYQFITFCKDNNTITVNININRKNKEVDLYAYRFKEIFGKFSDFSKDSDEYFYESIINKIEKAYEYAEFYINNVQEGGIDFEEDKFISELIYSLVQTDCNKIYKEYYETYTK